MCAAGFLGEFPATQIGRARLSSGPRRTDSTPAAADPRWGRPPPAQDRVHVVAAPGPISHRAGAGDRPPGLTKPLAAARRSAVLPYRLGMPARKRPTPADNVAARRILLDGLPATLTPPNWWERGHGVAFAVPIVGLTPGRRRREHRRR